MKRLLIVCLTILIAAFAVNTVSAADGVFSNPILVGGDEPTAAADQKTSEATSLKAFVHPLSQPADKNFKLIDGKIVPDDIDPIFVDDVAATPGHALHGKAFQQSAIEHPQSKIGSVNIYAVGPEDIHMTVKDIPANKTTEFTYEFDGSLGSDFQSHRMALGDIRVENPAGEFQTLFAVPPLEEVLIGGVMTPLIGNANEDGPYDMNSYPATIMSDPGSYPFMFCPFNFSPLREAPMPPPTDYPCWDQPTFSDNKYDKVYLYDVANLGNGLVAPSYDPLYLHFRTINEEITENVTQPCCSSSQNLYVHNGYLFSYFSPLTLFRKVEEPNDIRYRFSSYSSIEFPKLDCVKNFGQQVCDANWWHILPSNWLLPVATNPISVEPIDLGGKASWQIGGDPTVPFPDRDVAVTYQTTLFNMYKHVPDIFGRPAVFGDGNHYKYGDLIGTCDPTPCSTASFQPLNQNRFPDDIVSFALLHKQVNKWAEGADNAPYINANASNIFSVRLWALIGEGAYDSAVLTDFSDEAANRKQYLLVPSVADDPTDPTNGVVYLIDPKKNAPNRLYFKRPWSHDDNNFSMVAPPQFNPVKPLCTKDYGIDYTRTPIMLPDYLAVQRPGTGFVPYQIRTGNLDGDKCEDFIITWRGKDAIQLAPSHAKFDDGGGNMFSGRVTLVLRTQTGTSCNVELPQSYPGGQYPNNMPTHIDVVDQTNPNPKAVVASATIGDFDSDGKNDIVAGNLKAEDDTAYAYAYWGGSSIPFDPVEVERFRTGFDQTAGNMGTGMIETDHTAQGPDALMQINGYPLMLPDISCPDYANPNDPSTGSVYESYVSLANNALTKWVNVEGPFQKVFLGSGPSVIGWIDPFEDKLPFLDAMSSKPLPKRCVDKPVCQVSNGTNLPFFANDPCCVDACGTNAVIQNKQDWVEKCALYVYAYGHFGRACNLKEYVYKWGDPMKADCDPNSPVWTENTSPSIEVLNRALAMDDDRGDSDSGETDFASLWRPDTVVDETSAAIADRRDLVLAQATLERATEGTAERLSQLATKTSDSPMPFLDIQLPFRALFALSLGDSPAFSATIREMQADKSMDEFEKGLSEKLLGSLIGAPNSLEMLFLQPTLGLLASGAAESGAMFGGLGGSSSGERALSSKSSSGRCSLVGSDVIVRSFSDEAISETWNKLRSKMSSFTTWLWDLLVPSAGAATCGDGNVEGGEQCDAPDICQFPGMPTCPVGYTCAGLNATTAIPCTCKRPGCGDGCLLGGEQCDPTSTAVNYGCQMGMTCNNSCTCQPGPIPLCPNGIKNFNEECDPWAAPTGCPAGDYCTGTCTCAPDIAFDVKLPMGMIMPGHREMTAVVRKSLPSCNYNGVKDSFEECDVAGLSDAAALAQIQANCPPAVPPAELDDCDMNDCTCDYKQPLCKLGNPGVECEKYSDCGADEICDVNCKCVLPPGTGSIPPGILSAEYNDCYIHADTFSGEAEAEQYKKFNDGIRAITGRLDDVYVEPEQRVSVICKVGAASAPGMDASQLSLSLAGNPIPDTADNLRPYMVIQNSGSQFRDSAMLEYKSFELIDGPTRILPMEGIDPATQMIKSVVLPSSSVSGVSPMSTTSVAYGSGGVTQINNMIEHRVYSVMPGQEFTVIMGGSAQTVKAQSVEIPEGAGVTLHEIKALIPPDCASWTGVAGYEGCPPIEDREFDGVQVENVIKSNMAAMSGPATSAVYTNLPWEPNLNYQFGLVQETYAKAGDPVPDPVEVPYGFLAGKPLSMGMGGGCGCNISNGAQGVRAMLPYLFWLVIPAAGVGVVRVRRRKK